MIRQTLAYTVLAVGLSWTGAAYCVPAAAPSNYEKVYSFQGGSDGARPTAGLIDVGGTLFGTTSTGGIGCGDAQFPGCGTLFSLNPSTGAETVLQRFHLTSGGIPQSDLIKVGGRLYGTNSSGGAGSFGTVFSMNPSSGALKVVYSFQGAADGAKPLAGLIDVGGTLYGTTSAGGGSGCGGQGCGTIFSLSPKSGVEKIVYSFQGSNDGYAPEASLIEVSGILYGTTKQGGGDGCDNSLGCGTAFSFDPSTGAETVLHRFGGGKDGAEPVSRLLKLDGRLYGTTSTGGHGGAYCNPGCGVVFSLDLATGRERLVHVFQGFPSDGSVPAAGLINVSGLLYGTTVFGGGDDLPGNGMVFSLDPKTKVETILWVFGGNGDNDGGQPSARLINVGGTLYGTTVIGGGTSCYDGQYGCGTVFAITP